MKFLVSADIHFHKWTDHATINKDGINSRVGDILAVFDQMLQVAHLENVKDILLLGDIFHSRSKIDSDVLSVASKKLGELASAGINIHILLGNHDISAANKDVNVLEIFKQFCTIYDKPDVHEFAECLLFTMPYQSNKIIHQKELRHLKKKAASYTDHRYKLFISHNGLDKAKVGPNEFLIEDPLSVDDMGSELYNLCLFGHYHKPQQMNKNTFYVGSPIQHSLGERGDDKGIWLVDTIAKTYTIIPTSAPRFVLCGPKEALVQKKAGNYVQIEVKTEADKEFIGSHKEIQDLDIRDNTVSDVDYEVRMEVEENQSMLSIAQKYVDTIAIDKGYDVDVLKKIGQEMLEGTE